MKITARLLKELGFKKKRWSDAQVIVPDDKFYWSQRLNGWEVIVSPSTTAKNFWGIHVHGIPVIKTTGLVHNTQFLLEKLMSIGETVGQEKLKKQFKHLMQE